MDIANTHIISVTTLKWINACRLYLKAQYLSDITNISGKTLTSGVLHGSLSNFPSSNLQWPNQSKPNKVTWKVWKQFITQTFCSSAETYDLHPKYILRCWLSQPSKRNKKHRYQYFKSQNETFISEPNRIQRWYVSHAINTITCIDDSSDTCRTLPLDCIPVQKKDKSFHFNYRHHIPQQFPQRPQHFEDYIQMQEEWVKHMISHYRQNVLEESLLTHIHLKSSLLITIHGAKGKKKVEEDESSP